MVSRLIEGEYFRIDQMLSSDYDTKISVNKKEFLNCIDRATLLVREGDKKPIVIEISDHKMELKIDSSMGSMNEEIDIDKEGKDILIGFNPKFLIDALKVIDDETIHLYLMNPKAPCFIRDDDETYRRIILEITIKDEFIKLGQALKLAGVVEDGVQAKYEIQDGNVKVNGEVDQRRGRKVYVGDVITFEGQEIKVIK